MKKVTIMNAYVKMLNLLFFLMTFLLLINNFDKNVPLSIDNKVMHHQVGFSTQKIIFGHTNHFLSFYNLENISNVDDLVSKVFCYTTNALLVFPLLTNFISSGISIGSEFSEDFLRQSTSRLVIKESLNLAIPIFQGIITTEIITKISKLIIKPVMAKVNFSPEDRRNLKYKFFQHRYYLIKNYLSRSCNETTAMSILKHFSFISLNRMTHFAIKFNKNKYTPEEYYDQWLNNPMLYEKLRFDSYLEIGINRSEAIKRIENIYTLKEMKLICPPESAFDDYVANDLTDTIFFHDYYVIKAFLYFPYISTDLDEPDVWRLKKAMYSLAIRQNDAFKYEERKQIILYCVKSKIFQKIIKRTYTTISHNAFLYCNEDSKAWNDYYKDSSEIDNFQEPTSYLLYFKIIIKKPFLFIDVNSIDANSKHYIILPKTEFILIEEKFNLIDEIKVHLFIMKTKVKQQESQWLSKVANEVSYYDDKINGEIMSQPFKLLYC
ncbi:uncharacterized protein LOC127285835 [Leptopilina boulardi]|uniref:uncharacterized protein LOC127285835 n=1 Tax=Leptopilina boulardi TaxID=63433 RepID=UPI0021F66A18|nr:uncharacterized protein LOC127285835 [Leptopilina boulardi]